MEVIYERCARCVYISIVDIQKNTSPATIWDRLPLNPDAWFVEGAVDVLLGEEEEEEEETGVVPVMEETEGNIVVWVWVW